MNYSIISTIVNNYDQPQPNHDHLAVQRILLSDSTLICAGWTTKQLPTVDHDHPFNTVFDVRWHPFNYCNTDYAVWVDGSLEIFTTLHPLITQFANSGADIGLLKHPYREHIFDEYIAWVQQRGYNKTTAFKWLFILEHALNIDINRQPLFQTNIIIYKNTPKCINWCNRVWKCLHLVDPSNADRLDQTIASALSSELTVFTLNPEIYTQDKFFHSHYNH